ncbi:MAG: outer membrane protein assembly factor BamA [Magnetococcales bacterium]|nr:outer membrane protein assembly factor BamA [Magnetococcales bacterium]
MNFLRTLILALFLGCVPLVALLSVEPAWGAVFIDDIRVEGSRRIEPDTVKSHLLLDVGDRLDSTKIRKSIKALHDTGFFQDVLMERDGNVLVVRVKENPMVNEVTFEGNDAYTEDDLLEVITLKSGALFNQAKVDRDLATLRQGYRIKGLFLAQVEMVSEELDQNRINLTYRIQEGEKSKVREVRIIGNSDLTDKELIKDLLIKPTNWLSWWREDDTYDREKLLFDQAQLRNIYLDRGYARVRVDSSVAELTPDRSAFMITHTVNEGSRYKLAEIRVIGDFDEMPRSEIYQHIRLKQGEWYSRKEVRSAIEVLTDKIGDYGYAFLQIQPETSINDDDLTVNLIMKIDKGQRVYVNRVEVAGNTRTRDNVIRREIKLLEGDRFSASKMRSSKKKLQSLDYFETVEVTTVPAGEDDKVDVKVKVEEKPTGTFSVGAGYSSVESFMGTASVTQNNFLGKGQRLVLSFAFSGTTNEFELSFTEPYFMEKNVSAGFDLFNRTTDWDSISSYEQQLSGGGLRLGFPLSNHLWDTVSYQLAYVEIEDVDEDASNIIKDMEQRSPYLQSMVSNTLQWDSLNNRILPSKGRRHRLTTDFSGLGGDVYFARMLTDHSYYHPISEDEMWVGHIRGRFGVVEGIDEEVPIFERFFLGGNSSIRGFKPGGVGPRTPEGDAYGGNHFEQINAELYFPIIGLKEYGVRGLTFFDAGYIGDWDDYYGNMNDDGSIRLSGGVGVHWNSPFGPLRVTLGIPIQKEDYDETRTFDFTFGAAM